MSLLIRIQAVIGVLSALAIGALGTPYHAASFAVGAGLMAFNVALLGWTWSRLFEKKSIAWTLLVIVIKYAILISSVFILSRTNWFSPLWMALGIASFILALVIYAVKKSLNRNHGEKEG